MTSSADPGPLSVRTREQVLDRFKPTPGSRFFQYVEALEHFSASDGHLVDSAEVQLVAEAEHQCLVACEAAESFGAHSPWSTKLAGSLNGPAVPRPDSGAPKHDAARDTLLEVWLASRLERAGFSARVQEPDIGLEVHGTDVGVAVKRLTSLDQLEKRTREAARQVSESTQRGIIALDLSFAIGEGPHGLWQIPTIADKEAVRMAVGTSLREVALQVGSHLKSASDGTAVIGFILCALVTMRVGESRQLALARQYLCVDLDRSESASAVFTEIAERGFVPRFMWDVDVTSDELRDRLGHPDLDIRAQWQGAVLREAGFSEIWSYLALSEVLANWQRIRRHLGRKRAFWDWLLEGWRSDGLLPR